MSSLDPCEETVASLKSNTIQPKISNARIVISNEIYEYGWMSFADNGLNIGNLKSIERWWLPNRWILASSLATINHVERKTPTVPGVVKFGFCEYRDRLVKGYVTWMAYRFYWQLYSVLKYSVVHGDAIKWNPFPRYWPFVRGIHRSPVNSPHKGQWRWALMFSLIRAWTNR